MISSLLIDENQLLIFITKSKTKSKIYISCTFYILYIVSAVYIEVQNVIYFYIILLCTYKIIC